MMSSYCAAILSNKQFTPPFRFPIGDSFPAFAPSCQRVFPPAHLFPALLVILLYYPFLPTTSILA